MKVSKTGPPHLYINILDFKDEIEQEVIFNRIQGIITEYELIRKVFK